MKSVFKWFLRVVLALVILVVILLVTGFCLVNSNSVQNELVRRAKTMLQDKLQTRVDIDSVSINLVTLNAELYGLYVEDRQQRPMLRANLLKVKADLMPLIIDGVVRIEEARLKGIHAEIHHIRHDSIDSVPNYKFILDAFKRDHNPDQKAVRKELKKKKQKIALSMSRLTAEDIDVQFNQYRFSLGALAFKEGKNNKLGVNIERVSAHWDRTNKKGWQVSHAATIANIALRSEREGEVLADIRGVHFRNDNHHPRKNAGKPKRGFFDAEHVNAYADMKLNVDFTKPDSIFGRLAECTVRDTIMGVDVRDLHTNFYLNKEGLHLRDFFVQQINTTLRFDKGLIQLPSKKLGRPFRFRTSFIHGRAILKDISRPFAPVLKDFSEPLLLSVRFSGDATTLRFDNVRVNTADKQLQVAARGTISGLKNKTQLRVHFDIERMEAKGGSKERIIKQFPVKRLMMKQLHALGTLHYAGSFNVLYKKEEFQGRLSTAAGALNFYFALDENNKYLSGRASTDSLEIGRVMDMKDIGPVAASATFKIDISKPRTAVMRKRLGGKLPIGEVHAHVSRASYKFVRTRDLTVNIVSNGAVAEGNLDAPGKWMDLSCTFSFTNTNEMQKTKIKPKMKLHLFGKSDLTDEEKAQLKAEKETRKAQKRADKEARKAQKREDRAALDAEKQLRKAEKQQQKAAEKAAKAEAKAAKDAAKAAEKQAKAEAKAQRKAEKAAAKAAKKAAKAQSDD